MKMLVTGATGKLGSKIVEKLLETVPADQLAVSVRNPEKRKRCGRAGSMCATGILTARKHWNPHFEALTVC